MASYCFRSHPKKGRGTSFPLPPQILHDVCQMSGGRQAAMSHHYFPFVPPHLTLPGKTTFLIMVYFWPSQCDFKKFSRVTQKIKTQTIFSILLKINILCVEFLNCFAMKFLTNLTELHLEISQSLMIIQLLTHYTKSISKSLISRCNTQSNLSNISLQNSLRIQHTKY